MVVLDGRPVNEFRKMNIPTALCCPNGELPYRVKSIVPDDETPIVVNCAGRTRSIIGAQTLINLGVRNPVYAQENGTQGWYLRDHQLEHGGTRTYAPDIGTTALRESARHLAASFGAGTVGCRQRSTRMASEANGKRGQGVQTRLVHSGKEAAPSAGHAVNPRWCARAPFCSRIRPNSARCGRGAARSALYLWRARNPDHLCAGRRGERTGRRVPNAPVPDRTGRDRFHLARLP